VAEADLEEILDFIAIEDRRPETAERVGRAIREAVERRLRLGLPGHTHAEMPPH
jgi:plasmid stabilization system protein ParE